MNPSSVEWCSAHTWLNYSPLFQLSKSNHCCAYNFAYQTVLDRSCKFMFHLLSLVLGGSSKDRPLVNIFIPNHFPFLFYSLVNGALSLIGPYVVDILVGYINHIVVTSSQLFKIFDWMIVLRCWWNRISRWGIIYLILPTAVPIKLKLTNNIH